jgi:hypothetical protein
MWLKVNNPLYVDINIADESLAQLPEDNVPQEIGSIIQYDPHDEMAVRELDSYLPKEGCDVT